MMGPFTGPMLPVRGQPPVGSTPTLTDLMPVVIPLALPAGMRKESRPVKPRVEPLDFQPVDEQERNKRRPVRIPAPASTVRPDRTPTDPLEMIFNVVKEKLSELNIF